MALVESRYYDDDPALSRQVGQYTPPPPVRLQRSGIGRVIVAGVAAFGACGALLFALYGTPAKEISGGETVIALEATPAEDVFGTPPSPEAIAAEQTAARQLAILANVAPPPVQGQTVFEELGVEEIKSAPLPVAEEAPVTVPSSSNESPLPWVKPTGREAQSASMERPNKQGFQTASNEPASQSAKFQKASRNIGVNLNPAPLAAITEPTINGLLPVVGPRGEMARDYYARPFPANEDRPRISLVVGGLGLSQRATEEAIANLPPEVTLAFAPYGKNLQGWIDKARAAGHEVLLELPMEPFDYPANDPGPYTLLTKNDPMQNSERLAWLLAQFNGYIGVTNYLGAKFTASPESLMPVLRELDERGLMVLDDGTSNRSLVPSMAGRLHIPYAHASKTVDLRASRNAIDDNLLDLESIAMRKGAAIGMGFAYPVTIERIVRWTETLEDKGLVLAPVSANLKGATSGASLTRHGSY